MQYNFLTVPIPEDWFSQDVSRNSAGNRVGFAGHSIKIGFIRASLVINARFIDRLFDSLKKCLTG